MKTIATFSSIVLSLGCVYLFFDDCTLHFKFGPESIWNHIALNLSTHIQCTHTLCGLLFCFSRLILLFFCWFFVGFAQHLSKRNKYWKQGREKQDFEPFHWNYCDKSFALRSFIRSKLGQKCVIFFSSSFFSLFARSCRLMPSMVLNAMQWSECETVSLVPVSFARIHIFCVSLILCKWPGPVYKFILMIRMSRIVMLRLTSFLFKWEPKKKTKRNDKMILKQNKKKKKKKK